MYNRPPVRIKLRVKNFRLIVEVLRFYPRKRKLFLGLTGNINLFYTSDKRKTSIYRPYLQ